jgi:hypothetical protein
VELFREVRWLLILVVSISLYFPLNVPLAALAYRVQRGTKPIPLETGPFWTRSAFVALGLTILSYLTLGLDYFAVSWGLPADVVHLVFLGLYLPVGVWYVFWMFELEEALEAFNILLIYVALPGLPLALIVSLGFDLPVWLADSWLKAPS